MTKLTAQEMFEKWWNKRAETDGEITGAWFHDINTAYLAAHSAQQSIIDKQAGEIAQLKHDSQVMAEQLVYMLTEHGKKRLFEGHHDEVTFEAYIIARQALAGKEGVK